MVCGCCRQESSESNDRNYSCRNEESNYVNLNENDYTRPYGGNI